MRKRDKLLISSIIALIIAMIAWGTSFVSNKIVIEHMPPVSSAVIRFSLASFLMFALRPFVVKSAHKDNQISESHRGLLFLSALTGISLYFIFENYGLYFTTASLGALITSSIPVMALLFEIIFNKKKATLSQSIGVILSIVGVYFLTNTSAAGARNHITGNLLILGSCICWVLFNFFSIKIQKNASTFTVTAWQNFYGALFLVPFLVIEWNMWKTVPFVVWLHLLYLAVVCSVICYFLYNYALRGVGSVTSGAFINLIPVVGAVCGVVFLKESLELSHIIGGVLVLGAIVLIIER